jgi:anti-sigma factor RsiW
MTPPPNRPTDDRLPAWLDGELDTGGRADVDACLRDHPEDAAQARLRAADRDALRARFDPVPDEPTPAAWRQTVLQAGRAGVGPGAPWRRVAVGRRPAGGGRPGGRHPGRAV